MPRRARIAPGEIIYHALNRANGRSQLFDKPEDYAAFERIMVAAMRRSRMGERGTNRSRDRSAAEMRQSRDTLRHGNLADTDRGYARIEIHTLSPRQT
jgi:hypothetical protein